MREAAEGHVQMPLRPRCKHQPMDESLSDARREVPNWQGVGQSGAESSEGALAVLDHLMFNRLEGGFIHTFVLEGSYGQGVLWILC